MYSRFWMLSLALLACQACSSTQTKEDLPITEGTKGQIPAAVEDEEAYASVLSQWQRDVTLYDHEELLFQGKAVLMSAPMRTAYQKQVEKILGVVRQLDPILMPQDTHLTTVVFTVHILKRKFIEVDDTKIWNLTLYHDGTWFHPTRIAYYRNKSAFVPYFDTGSYWSRMYVIQFPVAQESIEDPAHGPIVFAANSGVAKANFEWKLQK